MPKALTSCYLGNVESDGAWALQGRDGRPAWNQAGIYKVNNRESILKVFKI